MQDLSSDDSCRLRVIRDTVRHVMQAEVEQREGDLKAAGRHQQHLLDIVQKQARL